MARLGSGPIASDPVAHARGPGRRRHTLALAGAIASLAMLAAAPAGTDETSLAEAILRADATDGDTPRVSVLDPAIDLAGAYRVQQIIVDRRLANGDTVAGFKAGLTGRLARWWFDIEAPVFGVILGSALHRNGDTLAIPRNRHMLLETEIAFVAGSRIDRPLADIAELKPLIRAVVPVIEAPAGGFPKAEARKLTVADIVANNVSAHALIVGKERPAAGIDLKALQATLSRDGKALSSGSGADAMGDPWTAALWLVNVAVARGRVVEPGHVLTTGVIGKRIEAEPGRYSADFGTLGRIDFEVR